jgi:drug/metabolite transporter (DMT)-like permease
MASEFAAIAQRAGVIVLYLALNISINLLNKFIISRTGFAFPLAISISHMAFTTFFLMPVMLGTKYRRLHANTLNKNALGLAVIGISFSINLAMNNMSLTLISLSLNQMIRASIPVVTAACSVVLERVVPTTLELLALGAITVGIITVLAKDVHANTTGVTLCALSTVANGVMMSMSGAVLNEKLDVWRLSFYQAPIVLVTLLPFYIYAEHADVMEYLEKQKAASFAIPLIGLTCVIALAYNVVHGIAIKMTSATTTTVIGQGKILFLLFLSALLLEERDFFQLATVMGGTIAIAGFALYSWEKIRINVSKENVKL